MKVWSYGVVELLSSGFLEELWRSRVVEEWSCGGAELWRSRGVELLGSGGDRLWRTEVMEFWRSEVVEE